MSREEDLIPLVIAAAHAAAGKNAKNSEVVELIPSIAAAMSDGSREWKTAAEVLGAAVFTATFVSFQVEESSTRCLVQLDTGRPSKNYPDGIEPIRSHRTDGPQGRSMQKKLAALSKGDKVLVWKSMDEIADGQKARLLSHIQWIGRGDTSGQQATHTVQPDDGPPVRRGPEQGPPPPSENGDTSDDVDFAVEQFDALNGKDKAAVAKLAREAGIGFPRPAVAEVNQFLAIVGKVTGT